MTEFNTSFIEGVVPAAGFSSRAGAFKMDLLVDGRPLLLRVLDAMRVVCAHVFVVAGFKMERVQRSAGGIPWVSVLENRDYADGMFSSVKTGVRAVTAPWFFFCPGDYPLVSHHVYRCLLAACEGDSGANGDVFIPVFNGRKGHPVLMKGSLKEELLAEPAHSNLKAFINRKGFIPVPVQDQSVLLDIDTPEDYARAKEVAAGRGPDTGLKS